MDFKRITIFAGNFGSGKTELSINYGLELTAHYSRVALADLDVINPYFRSREKVDFLEEKGIEVIFPKKLAHADLPIISPMVKKIIQTDSIYGVFDIGGNDDGAIALGSISRQLKNKEYEMNFVVNTLRPYTDNLKGIIEMKKRIEVSSRLEFDNLIYNTNLGAETDVEHIKSDYPLIKKASDVLELPLKFMAVKKDLLPLPDNFKPGIEIFPVKIYMHLPWVTEI